MNFTRDESLAFFKEHNRDDMHLKHALAVEAAMKFFAEHYGEDVELWSQVGLLHDIDWETTQSAEAGHPTVGGGWLKEKGYSDEFVRAVVAHGNWFIGRIVLLRQHAVALYHDEACEDSDQHHQRTKRVRQPSKPARHNIVLRSRLMRNVAGAVRSFVPNAARNRDAQQCHLS